MLVRFPDPQKQLMILVSGFVAVRTLVECKLKKERKERLSNCPNMHFKTSIVSSVVGLSCQSKLGGKVYKDITSYQHPGCYRGWVIARFGLQWNIYSDTKLWYETGLLIGHTHILFYFIFQLLVQKHKIFNIKGVSKVSFTCGYSHWPKFHQTKWIELF